MKNFRTAMAIGATLALLASPVAFAQKTLRVATLQGAAQPSHKGLVKMAELVKERTNGALTIQVFGDGQLGTEQESIEGVRPRGRKCSAHPNSCGITPAARRHCCAITGETIQPSRA